MATDNELKTDGILVLMDCIEAHYPERQIYRDVILRELLEASIRCNPRLLSKLSFEWRDREETVGLISLDEFVWSRVERLIEKLDNAVSRFPDDGKTLEGWSYQPISKLDQKQTTDESANLEELSDFCHIYLQNRWATSSALNVWLVRQMIFAEIFASARGPELEPSNTTVAWTWAKSLVKWIVGLAVAVSIGGQYGWCVGILAYVAWISCIRYLATDQIEELKLKTRLFSRMRMCYFLAIRQHPCPAEINDALSRAEAEQAVWPEGLRPLIEAQLLTNRQAWA